MGFSFTLKKAEKTDWQYFRNFVQCSIRHLSVRSFFVWKIS